MCVKREIYLIMVKKILKQPSFNVEAIFNILSNVTPHASTELNYINHFTLLVAIVLSAQSTDVGVNKATKRLFAQVLDPYDMIQLGEDGLKDYIKTIGLYNSKAKNIMKLSEILIEKHNAKVPDDFASLIALPGVGRKTANVFLNCAYNLPTIAVDTHVARVSYRIGMTHHIDAYKIEQDLLKIVPKDYLKNAHHLLILHGRYVCKARKPQCSICPIERYCIKHFAK